MNNLAIFYVSLHEQCTSAYFCHKKLKLNNHSVQSGAHASFKGGFKFRLVGSTWSSLQCRKTQEQARGQIDAFLCCSLDPVKEACDTLLLQAFSMHKVGTQLVVASWLKFLSIVWWGCLSMQHQSAYISAVLHPLHPGEHLPGVPAWVADRWPKLRGTEGPEGKCGLSIPFVKQACRLALIILTISRQISSRTFGN